LPNTQHLCLTNSKRCFRKHLGSSKKKPLHFHGAARVFKKNVPIEQ
jgi:hypothetical protein